MPRKKMLQGFNSSVAKHQGGDWGKIRGYNNAMKRLGKRRVRKLGRTGKYKISQIALQAAMLQQSLLYRVVMLATATAKNWNQGNVLGSAIAARALLETIALIHRVENELFEFAEKGDFGGLQKHVTDLTFATRDKELIAHDHEIQARNAVTYITHFDKAVPGITKHYEFLCEWCHPNVFGHYVAFATYDEEANAATFCAGKMHCPEMLDALLAVYSMLEHLEGTFDRWNETIDKAAAIPSEPIPAPERAAKTNLRLPDS